MGANVRYASSLPSKDYSTVRMSGVLAVEGNKFGGSHSPKGVRGFAWPGFYLRSSCSNRTPLIIIANAVGMQLRKSAFVTRMNLFGGKLTTKCLSLNIHCPLMNM